MQYPKYQTLTVSSDAKNYTFLSSGPKGEFKIQAQFLQIENSDVYNLGFGALDAEGSVNDTIILNNGDRDKILATIAGFVSIFFETYHSTSLFFSGSTPSRTRLYRRAISLNLKELQESFEILGITYAEEAYEDFNPSKDYDAFLVRKLF